MREIIARGAEAILEKENGKLIKKRIKKDYRHEYIDNALRKYRTRREARILEKLSNLINVPKIHHVDEEKGILIMDFIDGERLSDYLERYDKNLRKFIANVIGRSIAKIHNANIIHGDLTTSNMIYKEGKIYFIDFGLAFHSNRIEDKAVDIYLLGQAIKSKHYSIYEEFFDNVLKEYFKHVEQSEKIKKQLKKVEERGRYKKQRGS
jgi:TP53 regulating kinase-like protein